MKQYFEELIRANPFEKLVGRALFGPPGMDCPFLLVPYGDQSQIGGIFKSKANDSYCLWLSYVPESVEKPLREARGFVYVYKCLTFDLSGIS